MNWIDPGKRAQSAEQLWTVFLFCIQNGIERALRHIFHLYNLDLRQDVYKRQLLYQHIISRPVAIRRVLGDVHALLAGKGIESHQDVYKRQDYFGDARGISLFTLLSTLVILLVAAPLGVPVSRRFGKKEASVAGMLFSSVVFAVMYVLKLQNMWLFLWLGAIGYLGLGFFNTVIWANITDVIDDQEVQTGHRDDGTVYAAVSYTHLDVYKRQAFGGVNEQKLLLEAEGVEVTDGYVDMELYQWKKLRI